MQAIEKSGHDYRLPKIDDEIEYFINVFLDAGPSNQTPMGEVPLDWPSILAFAITTYRIAEPWEFQTIIDMSRGYVSAKQQGAKDLAVAPVDQLE
jgi:hypothetical protein